MKKRVTVVLEFETDDEINFSDKFIQNDLKQEIGCASNDYDIISIQTEICKDGHEPHELSRE